MPARRPTASPSVTTRRWPAVWWSGRGRRRCSARTPSPIRSPGCRRPTRASTRSAGGGRWLLDVSMAGVCACLAGPTLPVAPAMVVADPRARWRGVRLPSWGPTRFGCWQRWTSRHEAGSRRHRCRYHDPVTSSRTSPGARLPVTAVAPRVTPPLDDGNREFWTGGAAGELRMPLLCHLRPVGLSALAALSGLRRGRGLRAGQRRRAGVHLHGEHAPVPSRGAGAERHRHRRARRAGGPPHSPTDIVDCPSRAIVTIGLPVRVRVRATRRRLRTRCSSPLPTGRRGVTRAKGERGASSPASGSPGSAARPASPPSSSPSKSPGRPSPTPVSRRPTSTASPPWAIRRSRSPPSTLGIAPTWTGGSMGHYGLLTPVCRRLHRPWPEAGPATSSSTAP